jgi:hypothetical protein
MELLALCISKSRVGSLVAAETVRSVLESAAAEMWRPGEFRLEVVWKILRHQPGLSEADAAAPLLVFKTYEEELRVTIKLPAELSSVSPEERLILRDQLGMSAEDLTKVVDQFWEAEATAEGARKAAQAAGEATRAGPASRATPRDLKSVSPRRPLLVAASIAFAIGAAGFAAWRISGRPTRVNVGDVADLLLLEGAVRQEQTLAARIVDPKWEHLSDAEKQRIADELFSREVVKGVQAMTLVDDRSRVRVLAAEIGGSRQVEAN